MSVEKFDSFACVMRMSETGPELSGESSVDLGMKAHEAPRRITMPANAKWMPTKAYYADMRSIERAKTPLYALTVPFPGWRSIVPADQPRRRLEMLAPQAAANAPVSFPYRLPTVERSTWSISSR
jgi:hypothetical protein